jgi:hypothetical protein
MQSIDGMVKSNKSDILEKILGGHKSGLIFSEKEIAIILHSLIDFLGKVDEKEEVKKLIKRFL